MPKWFDEMFRTKKPVIGMVHLLALPGAPRYDAEAGVGAIVDAARRDIRALQDGGIDAMMFGNEADIPYQKRVGPETVASMTYAITRVLEEVKVPYGISVLYDFFATIAIAKATGAPFVRVIITGAFTGDLGIFDTQGDQLLRFRRYIDAGDVKLFSYVGSGEFQEMLAPRPIELTARGATFVGMADAVIVTGPMTGMPVNVEELKSVKKALPNVPLLIGTGATKENITELLEHADGVIVGTSLKVGGITWNPVDEERVKEFMNVVNGIR